jgi:hypothetical protein
VAAVVATVNASGEAAAAALVSTTVTGPAPAVPRDEPVIHDPVTAAG